MHLKSLAIDELTTRGVDPLFAGVLARPADYHPELRFHVGETDGDYYVPDGVSDVVPLWEVNADSFVRWVRNGQIEYVWLYHDDPNWDLMAVSEQGIKARLWQSWAEMQESDDEIRRFAAAIGFRHCERALEIWAVDLDALEQWILELRD